jgi:hypothetical protein
MHSVTDYLPDLRVDLTAFGSLLKAQRRNASSGEKVNFNGSFFQCGHMTVSMARQI